MINFVFDTNSIISAHLLPTSIVRAAYNKALEQGVLLHSKDTLSELVQVFFRPKFDKYLPVKERIIAIDLFEKKSFLTDIFIKIEACRDVKDNKFLELALSGNAKFIITGDKDLLVLDGFHDIRIISAGDFLTHF